MFYFLLKLLQLSTSLGIAYFDINSIKSYSIHNKAEYFYSRWEHKTALGPSIPLIIHSVVLQNRVRLKCLRLWNVSFIPQPQVLPGNKQSLKQFIDREEAETLLLSQFSKTKML